MTSLLKRFIDLFGFGSKPTETPEVVEPKVAEVAKKLARISPEPQERNLIDMIEALVAFRRLDGRVRQVAAKRGGDTLYLAETQGYWCMETPAYYNHPETEGRVSALRVTATLNGMQYILLFETSGWDFAIRSGSPGFRFEERGDGMCLVLEEQLWEDGRMYRNWIMQEWLLPPLEIIYPIGAKLEFQSAHGESALDGKIGVVEEYGNLDDGSGNAHLVKFGNGVRSWAYPQELKPAAPIYQ